MKNMVVGDGSEEAAGLRRVLSVRLESTRELGSEWIALGIGDWIAFSLGWMWQVEVRM